MRQTKCALKEERIKQPALYIHCEPVLLLGERHLCDRYFVVYVDNIQLALSDNERYIRETRHSTLANDTTPNKDTERLVLYSNISRCWSWNGRFCWISKDVCVFDCVYTWNMNGVVKCVCVCCVETVRFGHLYQFTRFTGLLNVTRCDRSGACAFSMVQESSIRIRCTFK